MKILRHENILPLLARTGDNNAYYIITPYMSDGNLLNYLQDHKYLSLDGRKAIAQQVKMVHHCCFSCQDHPIRQ